MEPLISKTALLRELVDTYDVEGGRQVSAAKIYQMIRNQNVLGPTIGYWYPSMDGNGVVCSVCNTDIGSFAFDAYPFCPYCGTSMANSNEVEMRINKC